MVAAWDAHDSENVALAGSKGRVPVATNKDIVEGVLEGVFMRLAEVGDEYTVVGDQFVADGDTVVVLGSYTWKHKETGAPATVKMAHVPTVNDGKLATFQQHIDTVRVRELS